MGVGQAALTRGSRMLSGSIRGSIVLVLGSAGRKARKTSIAIPTVTREMKHSKAMIKELIVMFFVLLLTHHVPVG